ncbi:MAG TPA: DUF3459 domain-containing protein, partial [Nitrospiraceae bacterium]|nr:DUF3459 domain-containing protein [Nitrospiraceae bacterium]
QNHDQIGNRAFGDRLSTLVPSAALKVAAAAVLLAPQTPLLFMGEEYGETAPFLYFIDHGDPDLVEAVRQGRRKEFAAFGWTDVPDPQDPATFERSRIHPGTTADAGQTALLQWYRELIRLRTSIPALGAAATTGYECRVSVHLEAAVLTVLRRSPQGDAALLVLGFNSQPTALALHEPAGMWALRLFSENKTFGGQGRTALPERLTVNPEGVTLALAPYEVAVYLSQPA